jgi:hypothetical protein
MIPRDLNRGASSAHRVRSRMFLVTGAGFYQRARHFREPASRPTAPKTLNIHAGSLEQQEQLLGQLLRFDEAGVAAEFHEATNLLPLGFFDHDARGVVFFRKLDRSIRHRTAAQIGGAKIVADARDQGAKLRAWIARMGAHDLFVPGNGIGVERTQIFGHQQVLRFEVPVQRHLVGLRGGGDFIHADSADSPGVKQIACRFQNTFTRRSLGLFRRRCRFSQNLPLGRLTRYLPVSNILNVTNQYHDKERMSRVLFFEGKPEGPVMVERSSLPPYAAVLEAKILILARKMRVKGRPAKGLSRAQTDLTQKTASAV